MLRIDPSRIFSYPFLNTDQNFEIVILFKIIKWLNNCAFTDDNAQFAYYLLIEFVIGKGEYLILSVSEKTKIIKVKLTRTLNVDSVELNR